jgi:HEAT repeat protein
VFDDQKVSSKVDASFEALLKKELHQPKRGKIIYLRYLAVAACLALLVSTGLWFNTYQQNEEKRTEIISNLEDTSTGKRLEAVYEFSEAFKKEDQQIIDVLIKKLLNDTNPNVKIAIVDALLEFPKNENIRKSMIEALSQEVHPNVQIKLIKALSTLRETRAQKPLEDIVKDENTFDIVKNNATLAMANLKK